MAVLVFSYLTNKGDDSMTADLGSATFPQISFDCDGFGVNAVPGYAKQMNITEVRDTITPVLKNKCAIIVTTNNIPINFPENM